MSDETAANSLTSEQRRAVEHSGGPLIVLAGPGTGKTRTIIRRVARLVEKGAEPESIVAMTFTVKAAGQLRERLAAIMGALSADRVNIYTIHGLGNRLVRRFGDMLGMPPQQELIDAAQTSRMVTKIVLDHGLFRASRGEGLKGLVARLEKVFAGLANRGVEHARCAAFLKVWEARLQGPGLAPEDRAAQEAELAFFADAVTVMGLYEKERWKRGWITFDDLLTLPLKLLRNYPAALAICRGEYKSFVVDEFQDCNPAQIELLHLLAGDGSPDVCVVGDDDQAIYRFRGADEQAFKRFANVWPKYTVIELSENYRSEPPIIECGNALIGRAQVRFRPEKVIRFPGSKAPGGTGECRVEAVRLEDEYQEGEVIAAMIAADRAQTVEAGKPRPWKKYAVIGRTHLVLDRVGAALRVEGVPFDRATERDVLDDAGVDDVLAWVEWIVDPSATWAARRVLTRPPYAVAPDLVTTWESEFAAQRSQAEAGREGVEAPGQFDVWLARRAAGEPLALGCLDLYRRMAVETATARGEEAVFRIITLSDAAHAELLPARERARRVGALVALLGLARSKQKRLSAPGDLREFWRYLQELRDAKGGLPAVSSLETAVNGADSAEEEVEGDGRVQLLTAYAAKGLEFDTVFVARVKSPHGFPQSKRQDDEWEPPEGLFDRMDARPEVERMADEERRVFYVACTRAERRLVLLSKPNKTVTKTTNYFDELTRGAPLPVRTLEAADVLRDIGARDSHGAIEAAAIEFKTREAAREGAERLRRGVRVEAARALELMDSAGTSEEDWKGAAESLRACAAKMAVISGSEKGRVGPAWALAANPEWRVLGERVAALQRGEEAASAMSLLLRPMTPPLSLSYSTINSYLRCPLCFYLSRVHGLPDEGSDEANIGTVVHDVLKRFYDRWARADSEGNTRPGVEELVGMARRGLIDSLGAEQQLDRATAEQLEGQMRSLFANLHVPNAHIIETERTIQFDYPLDGHTHKFTAKLDRIDMLPDGGLRVIDYKTGRPYKTLLEPKKDDLQMGIYALALKLGKGLGWGDDVRGTAEYWCLATGERGTITLEDLDEAKVRAQIDEAARGMLLGKFPRGKACERACQVFGV